MSPVEFAEFPKMARLSRECIVTEKIDGTNAQVFIWDEKHQVPVEGAKGEFVDIGSPPDTIPFLFSSDGLHIAAGSRTQWITPQKDNYNFARWVAEHASELLQLGHGRHYGEWWGAGIQRRYDLTEKRFSLFNVSRWCLHGNEPQLISNNNPLITKRQDLLPPCVGLVPVLYRGIFTTEAVEAALEDLRVNGSKAAPGFMRPEGVVCFHTAALVGFKKTLEKDEMPKSLSLC